MVTFLAARGPHGSGAPNGALSIMARQSITIHNMESDIPYRSSTETWKLGTCDPVVGAIGLLRPVTVVDPGLHAADPWAVRFEAFSHVRIGGVVHGQCWLHLEGQEPVHLTEGDIFLLSDPPPYQLTSVPGAEPLDAAALWETADVGEVRIGSEADESTYLCSGSFWFDSSNASILIDLLPTLVHVRATDPRNRALVQVTDLLRSELTDHAVGRSLVLDHLAQILFVQVLRAHAEQSDRPSGWLRALNDDGIGAALRAMHGDVSHRWTLHELARIARMSRSAFAASFKHQVGTSPLEYLIQWRMSLARDVLRRSTRPLSELAAATGYESESAFSTAFRRVTGTSPRQFRDEARQAGRSF
jgi:AraC-like DNA-binding protein